MKRPRIIIKLASALTGIVAALLAFIAIFFLFFMITQGEPINMPQGLVIAAAIFILLLSLVVAFLAGKQANNILLRKSKIFIYVYLITVTFFLALMLYPWDTGRIIRIQTTKKAG